MINKGFIEELKKWCWKNNTIPMEELYSLTCVCGHSLLEHTDCDFNTRQGNECSHKFCSCPNYKKKEIKSKLRLMSLDGGWVNCIKLLDEVNRLVIEFNGVVSE